MLTCNTSNDGVDLSKREPLKDLAAILKRGTLRVLTENGAVSFYEYKDKFLGFEYDILDTFARSIGVDLEVVMISNPKDFVKKLNTFEGDIIACNKPITL
jgi:membrane-bound lytic murein transglycosylase F